MKIINVSQRSAEWRTWRSHGISASEAAIIMGRSAYKTPWRLWAEKTGLVLEPSLDNHPLIKLGLQQEPHAIQRFEEQHAVMLLPLCGESEAYPLMRASFDGLSENNEPVEVKCPHEHIFLEVLLKREQSQAYQLYWCQVQQQLLVADAPRGYLYFYTPEQDVEFVIERDEDFLQQLIATAMDFWTAVKTKREPNKDPLRDLYIPNQDKVNQWQQLAAGYRQNVTTLDALKNQIKALETQQANLEQSLVALMGDYMAAEHSGVRVNRFQMQGSIDYKAAINTLLPDVQESALENFRKQSSDRVRITCRDDSGKRAEVPFDAQVLKDIAGVDYWF